MKNKTTENKTGKKPQRKRNALFKPVITSIQKIYKEKDGSHNIGDIILVFFGWNDEFNKDASMIRQNTAAYQYIKCSTAYGRNSEYGICRPKPFEEWADDFLKTASYANSREIFSEIPLEIEDNDENCINAVDYFERTFEKWETEYTKKLVLAAANAISKTFSIRGALIKKIEGGQSKKELFLVLTHILIYAQAGGNLSIENKIKNKLGRPLPNVYIDTKGNIEKMYDFESRTRNATKEILVNYAATSFLFNRTLSNDYEKDWQWAFTQFIEENKECIIVLTCPFTFAEADAIRYKMKPKTLKVRGEEIILSNLEELRGRVQYQIRRKKDCNIRVYLTDTCLSCGYFLNECAESPEESNIKMDLYLPNYSEYKGGDFTTPQELNTPEKSDREVRQSFVVYDIEETKELYNSLKENIDDIILHSKELNLKELESEQKLIEEIEKIAEEFKNGQKQEYQ